jgi:hypothetical protein
LVAGRAASVVRCFEPALEEPETERPASRQRSASLAEGCRLAGAPPRGAASARRFVDGDVVGDVVDDVDGDGDGDGEVDATFDQGCRLAGAPPRGDASAVLTRGAKDKNGKSLYE